MPIYRYVCGKSKPNRCKLSDLPENFFDDDEDLEYAIDFEDDRLIEWTEDGLIDLEKSVIVQLVLHGMDEKREVKCPACGDSAVKIIGRSTFYFPGNCFLNKKDCKRQMMLHKLKTNDPYGHFRPEGDKEELIKKLKRGDKAPAKNFYPGGKGGLKPSSPHQPGS